MKKERDAEKAPGGKGREDTGQPVQDLLSEKQRLQEEKARLQEQLLKLQEQLDRYQGEQASLEQQVNHVEEESRRFTQQYVELEEQNSRLANLYVAIYRLHETLERNEVLTIIQEIVINLIGADELGIFELDQEKSVLSLVASSGINAERFRSITLGSGIIGRTALTGESYFSGGRSNSNNKVGSPDEANLNACIPLKIDGRVTGTIAVFRLLPQKPAIEDMDLELFDVLATHAATSLYCTRLHAKMGGNVRVTA